MDKRFFVTSQIRASVFFGSTAPLAFFCPDRSSRGRRAQGRSRLAASCAATARLGLDRPSTAACLIGSGLERPDGWPRLALSSSTGTARRRRLLLSRAGDLVAKSGASAASVAGQPH
jgi:hypothetical protein